MNRGSLDELRLGRTELRRRLTLALALRHPPSARWPDNHESSKKRRAPERGGWASGRHLMEWDTRK